MLRDIFAKFRSSNHSGRQAHPVSVSEATIEAYLDAARPGNADEPDALTALTVQTRRCADLVAAAPQAYAPAQLAHAAAAVTAQLARMGDAVQGFVAYYWPTHGQRLAEPAAEHLWAAARELALTAGLVDVAASNWPDATPARRLDPLAELVEAARACADQVCDSEAADAGPAAVARAITQTLAALEGVFAPVQAWIAAAVPGRGRELPEAARHHLAEATGHWAPITGLITHLPAEVTDGPETAATEPEASGDAAASPTEKGSPASTPPAPVTAPRAAKKAARQQR